eukprot:TRINITY_DN7627_c0_g1_i1.p1 TRINITY_DN7627_c0_g1~~TRINITY_DN7627_c0_g1_i1.p1  ORF type:complete len:1528 (+),score=500.57 TRINITY_DN7627_c0_g1_i1:83-4666(+)
MMPHSCMKGSGHRRGIVRPFPPGAAVGQVVTVPSEDEGEDLGIGGTLAGGPLRPMPPQKPKGLNSSGNARAYLRSVDAVQVFDSLVERVLEQRPDRTALMPTLLAAISEMGGKGPTVHGTARHVPQPPRPLTPPVGAPSLQTRREALLAELRSLDTALAHAPADFPTPAPPASAVAGSAPLAPPGEDALRRHRVMVLHTGGAMFSSGLMRYDKGFADQWASGRSSLHDPGAPSWHPGDHPLPPQNGVRTYYHFEHSDPLVDSCHVGSEDWVRMARQIEAAYADNDAFVIVHGTDTLAYTASALSFMLENLSKPVILTGSQLPARAPRSDAYENLVGALEAAQQPIPEVAVYFRGKLFRGNRVSLSNASSWAAFSCANFAPLASFDQLPADINWALVRRSSGEPLKVRAEFCNKVSVVALFPGMNLDTLKAQLASCKGVVLQSYGAGNAPDSGEFGEEFLRVVAEASQRGTIIVNVTQCKSGFVAPHYKTGMLLRRRGGVVAGADMTVEAAFAKLCWLLGQQAEQGLTAEQVKEQFGRNLRGEMADEDTSQTRRFLQSVLLALNNEEEGDSLMECPLCRHQQMRKWTGPDPQNRMRCDSCRKRTHGWRPVDDWDEDDTPDSPRGGADAAALRDQAVQRAILPTLLCSAAVCGELAQLQDIVAGADPREVPALLSMADYDGRTAMHLAAAGGSVAAIEFLAARGAELSPRDNFGSTPLYCAAWYGSAAAVQALRQRGALLKVDASRAAIDMCRLVSAGDSQRLQLLLDAGQDPNVWDYDLRTPLHVAIARGEERCAQLLIEHGAMGTLRDCKGRSAFEEAERCGRDTLLQLLRQSTTAAREPESQPEAMVRPESLVLCGSLLGTLLGRLEGRASPRADLTTPSYGEGAAGNAVRSAAASGTKEADVSRTRRVLVIYTGGTIGMVSTPDGFAPEAGYLPRRMRQLPQVCDTAAPEVPGTDGAMPVTAIGGQSTRIYYTITEYEPLLDSCNMRHLDWMRIANDIGAAYSQYDSFVVLHGTDTMAYTASALSFMLENLGKPVVITGSQIPLSVPRNDGVENLQGALMAAGGLDVPEVSLFFCGQLMRGNRCTKSSASVLSAFSCPNFPPLATAHVGWEVNWELLWRTPGVFRVRPAFCADVCVIPLSPGMDISMLRERLAACKAAVLQTFGMGNAPTHHAEFLRAIRDAVEAGKVLINVTQCRTGAVASSDDDSPSAALHDAGVVCGGDITVEAALAKLGWMLGMQEEMGWGIGDVRLLCAKSLRGERAVVRKSLRSTALPVAAILRTAWSAVRKEEILRKSTEAPDLRRASVIPGVQMGMADLKRALLPTLLCGTVAEGEAGLPHLEDMIGASSETSLGLADYDGRTPLHIAAAKGEVEVAKRLIDAGAPLDCRDHVGVTPLREAVWNRNEEVVRLLQSRGASLVLDEETACIDMCCLIDAGDEERLRLMLFAGQSPNVAEYDRRTPLHVAAARGNSALCKLLVQYGADETSADVWGNGAAEEALHCGHSKLAEKLRRRADKRRRSSGTAQ